MKSVSAFLLITLQAGKINQALKKLREIPEVKLASFVTGPYDIICLLEGQSAEILTQLVITRIHKIPGIARTMTCLAIGDSKEVSSI